MMTLASDHGHCTRRTLIRPGKRTLFATWVFLTLLLAVVSQSGCTGVTSAKGNSTTSTNSANTLSGTLGVSPAATGAAVIPAITGQPISQSVVVGQAATFAVTASGTAPLSYEWHKNGTAISGATSSSYTTPAEIASDNGAQFTVIVSNSAGNVTSSVATLTVTATPVSPSITRQPISQNIAAGQTATFSVVATGTAPLSYQWRKNGAAISGATASSYTTPVTTIADTGAQFGVVVSNSVGNATSTVATLTVAAPGQLSSSALSLTFGNLNVGSSSTQSVTLNNSGGSNISIANVTTSGAGFNVNGISAGLILSPGASVTMSVIFAPAASGSVTGSLTIASNSSNSPLTLALSGTGQVVAHSATLTWNASTSIVTGYNVYRGSISGGPYTRINSSLDGGTTFTDTAVVSGQTYFYVATAVDSNGVESSYSNQATAVIP